MRWYFKVMLAVLLGLVALDVAAGQQFLQIGGGFGGMGKGGPDPLALLRNNSVKKELRLTDAQAEKVNEAVWKALGEVLDADQLKRLKQIDLQQRDYRAFGDPMVQAALKLDAEQKANIQIILDDSDKEVAEQLKELKGGNFQGVREKILSIRKETKERCQGVLKAAQKRAWQEMIGDEFKIEVPKIDKK
jgi:hypothetical protein